MANSSDVLLRARARDTADTNQRGPAGQVDNEAMIEHLRALLNDLRFGSITLIVQDSRVVQIDTTHKLRLVTAAGATADR